MADEFKLDIFKRDNLSKSSLKQLRRDGNIPGIFYSYNSKESIPFYMGNKTLNEAKNLEHVFLILRLEVKNKQ